MPLLVEELVLGLLAQQAVEVVQADVLHGHPRARAAANGLLILLLLLFPSCMHWACSTEP